MIKDISQMSQKELRSEVAELREKLAATEARVNNAYQQGWRDCGKKIEEEIRNAKT